MGNDNGFKLINIGYGNMISAGRVIAALGPESAPVRRIIQEARERGLLIDASCGRKTSTVLIMDTNHVILSAARARTIADRWTHDGPVFEASDEE